MIDAVQESSAQTGNFGAEFGRAGGGVFNLITKSGSNQFYGALSWRIKSQVFDSVSNSLRLNTPAGQSPKKPVYTENIYGFTFGGPIVKNRTFFFLGFQQDSYRASSLASVVIPTEGAVTQLRSLFPDNPRLNLYLNAIGNLRGAMNPFQIKLGKDTQTNVERGVVEFATGTFIVPNSYGKPQSILRLDHRLSRSQQLSFRYIYDSNSGIYGYSFPGYFADSKGRHQNFLFDHSFTPSPTLTNEFRFSYGRIANGIFVGGSSVSEAQTLPRIAIASVSSPGLPASAPSFWYSNKWLFQETQSKIFGRHAFRYGFELLRQLSKERPQFNDRGTIAYLTSTSYSAFANFLDDYSGPSGYITKNFGDSVLYPKQFRQFYFAQDSWRLHPSLTLVMGFRYENYGSPANSLKFPAFAGLDESNFLKPNKVNTDNNNFAPSFGFAWSPNSTSGLLEKLFGKEKTVWRGGFQINYDSTFDNMIMNAQADSPNSVATTFIALFSGRGAANFSTMIPTTPRTATPLDSQLSVMDPNIRTPYTERWSFGFQREMPLAFILDLSYVGSSSHKQFTMDDLNVRQMNGIRINPKLGIRRVITSQGNANYNGMQLRMQRRFARLVYLTGSYTWSRSIDSTSEIYSSVNSQYPFTSIPISQGGLRQDRALSDFHRSHIFSFVYMLDIPGPQSGWLKQVASGWSLVGLTFGGSGAPFTVLNGYDRNNDGILSDRPDIGNPQAPLNTRAIVATACSSGWINPDTQSCTTPNDVHFIQGVGLPNSRTIGRNALTGRGMFQTWVTVLKTFELSESGKKLEFGLEIMNLFNDPQYSNIPSASVVGSPYATSARASYFLNTGYTNSSTRSMNARVKIIF